MTAPAIDVIDVSKRYYRQVRKGGSRLLSETAAQWTKGLLTGKKGGGVSSEIMQPFWALRDISFAVGQGEVVGIIGRNGSGKSTLLKTIAQITAPTAGEIRLKGRTGTLLEVGTGFHPELSGRENVFLNGAILGMSRQEIARKFDEIVDFSGVESFIDMPVKRYSSGMQTRLAFSVAAHLDPEILIVDEVLAVGDAEFQKKSLGKMNEVSKGGRTVLFVSHSMSAIDKLCSRVIWLDRGILVEDSKDIYSVASRYLFGSESGSLKGEVRADEVPPLENEYFKFEGLRVSNQSGLTVTAPFPNNQGITVEIDVTVKELHPSLAFGYAVYDEAGDTVFWSMMTDANEISGQDLHAGRMKLVSRIPERFLNQGLYRVEFMAGVHSQAWLAMPGESAYGVLFRIEGGLSDSAFWIDRRPGMVAPVLPWRIAPEVRQGSAAAGPSAAAS